MPCPFLFLSPQLSYAQLSWRCICCAFVKLHIYTVDNSFFKTKNSLPLSLSLSLSLSLYIYIYIYIHTHTHTHTHTHLFNSYRSLITTFFYSLSFYLSFHNLTIKEQPPFAYLAAFVKSKSLKSEILMSNGYSTIIFETC
jgi:hypothetical protein